MGSTDYSYISFRITLSEDEPPSSVSGDRLAKQKQESNQRIAKQPLKVHTVIRKIASEHGLLVSGNVRGEKGHSHQCKQSEGSGRILYQRWCFKASPRKDFLTVRQAGRIKHWIQKRCLYTTSFLRYNNQSWKLVNPNLQSSVHRMCYYYQRCLTKYVCVFTMLTSIYFLKWSAWKHPVFQVPALLWSMPLFVSQQVSPACLGNAWTAISRCWRPFSSKRWSCSWENRVVQMDQGYWWENCKGSSARIHWFRLLTVLDQLSQISSFMRWSNAHRQPSLKIAKNLSQTRRQFSNVTLAKISLWNIKMKINQHTSKMIKLLYPQQLHGFLQVL